MKVKQAEPEGNRRAYQKMVLMGTQDGAGERAA